jgi:hypothetical protein
MAPSKKTEHERAPPAAAPTPQRACGLGFPNTGDEFGIFVERPLALDQAARHVAGDRLHDIGDVMRLRQHPPADPGVVQEAVHALVAPHGDMGDGIDPQPRRVAARDAAIEQIDLGGNLRKQRIERFVKEFETGQFGVAQIDDDAGALGGLDARRVHSLFQRRWLSALARRRGAFAFSTPHRVYVPKSQDTSRRRRAKGYFMPASGRRQKIRNSTRQAGDEAVRRRGRLGRDAVATRSMIAA